MRNDPSRAAAEEGTSVLAEDDLELAGEETRAAQEETRAARPGGGGYGALDPRALLLGRSFGGFKIVRELASGGMASVFLARKDTGRVTQHAAIKVVHPHLAGQTDFVDMFLDEARIVSCVHHPNVCRVLDFGTEEGTYYLAMEYVLGETWGTLQSALSADDGGRKILPTLAAYAIAQACEGLHAAHEATDDKGESLHIVHRDISPQNIFVAYDGTVRVLDFGIARAADRITTTQAGTVKGRLAYMAPEQMEGGQVDRRADLWSLGVVLREALEGKRLFRRGTDAETMVAVTTEPMPPWSVQIPPKLQEIVERALERDPAIRYVTARQMGVDLMRFARAQPVPVDMADASGWMHRLFPQKLEEKRLMLMEQAPEPRLDATGNLGSPWPTAMPSGFTPSVQPRGPQISGEYSYSTTQAGTSEQAPRAGHRAAFALFGVVAAGAALGVWFARQRPQGSPDFAETQLAHGPGAALTLPSEPSVEPLPPRAPEAEPAVPEPAPSQLAAPEAQDAPAPEGTGGAPEPSARTEATEGRHRPRDEKSADAKPVSEERRKPAAQAAEPGTLAVAYAGGWAEIFLGDKRLGTTPGRFVVPAGHLVLTIKAFGTGAPSQRSVDVTPGATTKLLIQPDAP